MSIQPEVYCYWDCIAHEGPEEPALRLVPRVNEDATNPDKKVEDIQRTTCEDVAGAVHVSPAQAYLLSCNGFLRPEDLPKVQKPED